MIKNPAKLLTDVHIHSVSFSSGHPGNLLKKDFKLNLMKNTLSGYHGLDKNSSVFDELYLQYLSGALHESQYIGRGVVFGLDGIYDNSGKLDRKRTSFLISNDYVFHSLKPYPNLFFAASINPYREDALDELDKVFEHKAALVKVLPNTQHFDPASKKCVPFYKKLADLKLPLLGHTGYEFALGKSNHRYGNLNGYRLALDNGVFFIAAHACATGLGFFETQVQTMLSMSEEYKNFYMDLSALSLVTRYAVVRHIVKYPDLKNRFFYGSDFPLPVASFSPFRKLIQRKRHKKSMHVNYFDRYALFLQKYDLLPVSDPFPLRLAK